MPNIGFIRNTTLDLGHGYLVSCTTDKSNRTKTHGGYALPNHRLRFILNMTSILHRSLAKTYPNAVGGDGVYLVAANGQKVLDGSSGAAVSCLGHSHQAVIDAIIKQAQTLSFAHTSFFTNDPAEQLAALLIDQSGSAFSKVTFFSSGSEAVESALKLARHYHLCNNEPDRVNIIGRKHSYHGNTLGALAAGWNPTRRDQYAPLLSPAFHHVSRCFYSQDAAKGETPGQYVERLIKEYDEMFQQLGPTTIAAVIVEPVVGATLGSVPAVEGYLNRLRKLCDQYGSLLIYDEVMCGMGRAGTLHAWQSLGGPPPDLQTIGKGLAAGYQPLSAVLVNSRISEKLQQSRKSRVFLSGHTYQAHAIGCAAGLAVQQTLINDNLLQNVRGMGAYLVSRLTQQLPKSAVREIRGIGLFQTVEFAPIDPSGSPLASEVASLTFEKGAAVYLCSPAVDAVLFCPPFIISKSQVDELVGSFTAAVTEIMDRRKLR
ncbi:putative aminotransferase [Exophiala dermatitidis]